MLQESPRNQQLKFQIKKRVNAIFEACLDLEIWIKVKTIPCSDEKKNMSSFASLEGGA